MTSSKKLTPMSAIRALSGVITSESAVDRLAMVNLIARCALGGAEFSFVNNLLKENCGLELIEPSEPYYEPELD